MTKREIVWIAFLCILTVLLITAIILMTSSGVKVDLPLNKF
jgi:hypothetical protein